MERIAHPEREALRKEVQSLLHTAGESDWDGEGAAPVDPNAISTALKVVDSFQGVVVTPEVSANPHGRVDFDWHLENGRGLPGWTPLFTLF